MVSFILLLGVVATPAWAQVQMISISVPPTITTPLSGFNVQYSMAGSKSGVGAAVAQLNFYLSATANGSSGVYPLFTTQIALRGSGLGPYLPPVGTQTQFISRFSMPANTVAQLEFISNGCQPSTWYVLGRVDLTGVLSDNSLLGTTKPPDFFFTAGTLSPGTIQPGGSADLSFELFTRCAAPSATHVGVFLTDPDFQILEGIGAIPISAGAGTWSLPPTTITFSPTIAPGSYRVVVLADVDGVVAESDENNNGGFFELEVTAAALASDAAARPLEPAPPVPFDGASVLSDLESGASSRRDIVSF
ncbi:hypothetical protein HUA74_41185 [Myxococcus sp. CA051A]|uniref:hypothetical protein n=1 Tax=Myxococcus sp. CA051A TaxID=2741739 RepID=UPI00157AE3EE|nr:hypothetical protein [Myxococcus sp. CA051A]NTX67082.1 hypothetical protein [Myxococcus sp. CA051A]